MTFHGGLFKKSTEVELFITTESNFFAQRYGLIEVVQSQQTCGRFFE